MLLVPLLLPLLLLLLLRERCGSGRAERKIESESDFLTFFLYLCLSLFNVSLVVLVLSTLCSVLRVYFKFLDVLLGVQELQRSNRLRRCRARLEEALR